MQVQIISENSKCISHSLITSMHKVSCFILLVGFTFSFFMKCQSGNIVVLQISTFIHILDRKYDISPYHISIILFSSTIWQFHPRFFFDLKFFVNFIQNFTVYFLKTWCKCLSLNSNHLFCY